MNNWQIFTGNSKPHDDWELPKSPNWRPFGKEIDPNKNRSDIRGETFQPREEEIKMVNAALYLRRPLLITGKPGTGKSSLAYAVARELKLGEVLYWPITSRTVLKDGLYSYDAIARLQEVKQQQNPSKANNIEDYITLGSLGTALLPSAKPRILLIDEIDKSDIDLPNDLLNIFEEGRFDIEELVRLKNQIPTVNVRTAYTARNSEKITEGRVICTAFPLVILTSNGERDFPPPFLRRCLRLNMQEPKKEHLVKIIAAHLGEEIKDFDDSTKLKNEALDQLVDNFITARDSKTLANDQLLNALFMVTKGGISTKDSLIKQLLQDLGQTQEEEDE
ncbi:MoxR family ATPase [Dolichospermum sp. ST_sed1]|nr:MoxR family ATPase [Dolichospermum sp. ST_sed1]MDD1425256.1 MoxR family ATPase [Dolichospermum sp. ST_sed9]MDD1430466.1 MoxR family ATPase [Dolichospermum sp. ST_sed6]MDD1439159.1 MoxR family ATPase [Dolichospermum sp. ST_sed3]MDD1445228.1 MoxR family ATPase [Dolichospermum sp. ST_sed8]MDD1455105.1 MoxR family ATPase [Dolichospermum sp. ST_sed7]MDD1459701.1 MoxR family ATPase [Dolichospermum sp. ST_sed2]MDD1463980.1 MoxR family ATPase [Dolichospermum sp. ST_sed5]MDD1470398.1 MoxR family 